MVDGVIIESDYDVSCKHIKKLNTKFYKFNNNTILNINCIQSVKKTQINWGYKLNLDYDDESNCIKFDMSNGKSYSVCKEQKNDYERALDYFFPK